MSLNLARDEWADPSGDASGDASPPALHFPTLPAFVEHFASWYRREVFDGFERVWCPDWWRHPEAVVRLDAMWRALEALRQDEATGISVWLRDHVDVHMAQLLSSSGPFRGCSARDGHTADPLRELPTTPPPPGWWTEADSGL